MTYETSLSQLISIFGVARHELRQGRRSPEFWVILVIGAVATAVPCSQSSTTAGLAGYFAGQTAMIVLGFLGVIWFSLAACRDVLTRTDALILSKPSSGEVIVLGRFLGNYGVVLLLLLGELLAGAVAQTLIAKTPFAPMAYGHAFLRSLTPLFFLGATAYSLSLLFNTPVTGLLVLTYWTYVLTGKTYLRSIYNCALTQNAAVYILLGGAVLALAVILYHPKRRGAQPFPTRWGAAAMALFALGAVWGVHKVRTTQDFPFQFIPFIEAMRGQHVSPGQRAPGFWLPDQWGRTRRLEEYHGKILLIGLWSPDEPASADLLNALAALGQKYPRDKVVPIAIGISDDHAAPRHIARDSGYDFPVVTDIGARVTQPYDQGSPLASAYDANNLPLLVIADRRRVVVEILKDFSGASTVIVERVVDALLPQQF
ncbi:MAG: peroxiredoxin family protein [Abditibacteriales bacterium]|nr:peroxiredoxin family protein [Abditibacteriales bacterium]